MSKFSVMKKYLLPCLFFFLMIGTTQAQEGPGGVGNSSSNLIWLDANQLGLTNSDPVSSWTDFSGNSNHATQGLGADQPTFLTGQINGLPVVDFDGTSEHLDFGTHITSDAITILSVFQRDNTSVGGLVTLQNHAVLEKSTIVYAISDSPGATHTISKSTGSYSIFSMRTTSGTGVNLNMTNGSTDVDRTRNSLLNRGSSAVGARITDAGATGLYLDGQIAELIIYNSRLSVAERDIIIANLAAKYDLTATNSSIYSYRSTHPNDVVGIGQESDGSNTSARGNEFVEISNASTLGDGDYLLIGHDNGGYATSNSVPSDYVERYTQVWRTDVTGSPGTVDIEFFLDAGALGSPSDLAIMIETDNGDFSDGNVTTHTTGRSYSVGSNSITFTGVSLSDGDYFTLGELQSDITAIADGDWDQTATWSCTCIPGNTDIVNIGNTFDVTVDSDEEVLNLTIDVGGTLDFSGSNTLDIEGNLTVNGGITSGNGTITVTGSSAQTFDNGSGSTVALNNLTVNNASGLDINSGAWSIASNLQVSAGNLDVSGATSMTLLSTASATSQILESVSNAFTGDLTIQRYIGSRNANFANFGIPILGATVADIDDDLFISGVGGPDGNALKGNGDIFYSIHEFDRNTDTHVEITSTTASLGRAKGYEVWLATTFNSFSSATIDYTGTVNNGLVRSDVNVGWNLIGNPFHSYIDWDLVGSTGPVSSDYYIFDTDAGSYTLYTGAGKADIAPEQGFWVFQSATGGFKINFEEADKVSSNSPTFIRKKLENELASFEIVSSNTDFRHRMELQFDIHASEEYDNLDAPFLPSPINEAPAIYTRPKNSKMRVVKNSLNPNEATQMIPISIIAGESGNYSINANNIDEINDNYSCVFLKDNKTNESIDLSVEHKYSFQSNVVDDDNRFNLVLSNSYDACQNLLNQNGSINQKLDDVFRLRNYYEDWFLDYSLHNEGSQAVINVYNLSGQSVMEPLNLNLNGSGSIPIHQLRNLEGVYMIQVISNDEILNQTVKL